MKDVLPEDHKYLTFLKKVARHEFRKNGFKRISTPVLEKKELFVKSIWEGTDVVDKEMFEIIDKKWRSLVMRPECTAWVMRAYINADLQSEPQPVYLYYMEPQFRYDRPQKWRYREFYQIWAEAIWESDPVLDALLILRWYMILNKVGLEWDFKIKLNSIWNSKEREKYREALRDFYENKRWVLCKDCQRRMDWNILRLLDCKNEDCQILKAQAPQITKFFKKASKEHYAKVKEYLEIMEVPYEEDHTLVRWLDYYCHSVWEYVSASTTSQNAFWWGGRYDGLAEAIGNKKEIPAVWFALWAERIIEAIQEKWLKIKDKDKISLYFIQLWEEAKKLVLPLAIKARAKWVNTQASLGSPSLKTQLKKANRLNAKYVAIVGIMEARNGVAQVKDMEAWTQEEVKLENLLDYIIEKIWEENLDFYSPSRDWIIEEKTEIEDNKKPEE